MNLLLSFHWFLVAAAWYAINGVLHDVFVIKAHEGPYNRELLRLLTTGHLLILSGIIMAVCWYMLRANLVYGAIIGLVITLGMVVYCIMIFPFLKSIVTLVLSIILMVVSINAWMKLRS